MAFPPRPGVGGPVRIHELPVEPGVTAHVGVFGGGQSPVLRVSDGDEVVTGTLGLWAGRVTRADTLADVLRLRAAYPGVGPHTLTGPIAVDGARPGDALRVEILDVRPGTHGFNLATPHGVSRGVLSDRFPDGILRHFDLDPAAGVATSGDLRLPIRPFPGFVGVSPAAPQPHGSVEPGPFGGNLDIADMVSGSAVWLPVQREGGLLYLGDGHAAQGNGELDGTAIECDLEVLRVRLRLAPGVRLRYPRITSAEHLTTVGLGASLAEAVRVATEDMVTWAAGTGLAESDAYVLCSVAGQVSVSQVVNRVVGVHLRLGRDLLPERAAQWP